MNKQRVNAWLPAAKEALKELKIADEKDEISKTFRGQISSFGAAVVMGSLPAAVAFFSAKGGSEVDRPKLMQAIYYVIAKDAHKTDKSKWIAEPSTIFAWVCNENSQMLKEKFIDAAIALKLAMNLYHLA